MFSRSSGAMAAVPAGSRARSSRPSRMLVAAACVLGACLSKQVGTAFSTSLLRGSARTAKTALAAKKGFGAPAGPKAANVEEPEGGWPTISVLVVSPESKTASSNALKQLAEQDYPMDKIQEVVILGADELANQAPKSIKGALKDFSASASELNLAAELAACTGDLVAIWGDDHVSGAHRLKTQVVAALGGMPASVLQPSWFFDPEDHDFMKVRTWPLQEFEEFLRMQGGKTAPPPKTMAKMMVCADPLTLVGQRNDLLEASSGVAPSASPTEELKELLTQLVQAAKEPKLLADFTWAACRSPPAATRYEAAVPERILADLAKGAFPKDKDVGGKGKKALDATIKEAKSQAPAEAIANLLDLKSKKPATGFDLKRVTKAALERLDAGGAPQVHEAMDVMMAWDGLKAGQGGPQAAKDLPVFFAVFSALREHIKENADFWDIKALGKVSEDLVKLGMKIWAADNEVNEALAKILSQELYKNQIEEMATDRGMQTADICGTLGLRPALEAIAFAALDLPEETMPASSLASLAWALAEAGVENSSLQMKVAKGLINKATTMTPQDIGNTFVALDSRQWFKDPDSIAYLTEALLGQVRNLKRQNPSLAAALAANQAA